MVANNSKLPGFNPEKADNLFMKSRLQISVAFLGLLPGQLQGLSFFDFTAKVLFHKCPCSRTNGGPGWLFNSSSPVERTSSLLTFCCPKTVSHKPVKLQRDQGLQDMTTAQRRAVNEQPRKN